MGFDEYNATVMDHFLNPRNTGDLRNATASATVTNAACGDTMKLALRVVAGRIAEARTRTFGCAAAIACSSALTEILIGRTLDEALAVRDADVVAYLHGLPEHKLKCSLVAEDATRAAVAEAKRALSL